MRRAVCLLVLMALAGAACATDGTGGDDDTGDAVGTSTSSSTTSAPPAGSERAACSAADLPPDPEPRPDLHGQVAEVRTEIARLAVACDFQGLADVARRGGSEFTASFGGASDPAELWARRERRGGRPMRFLRLLLDRPFATTEYRPDRTLFVWPSAFVFDDWADVPDGLREGLKPLYGEDDFEEFAEFGSYLGYRIGIESDGNWVYFVRGD